VHVSSTGVTPGACSRPYPTESIPFVLPDSLPAGPASGGGAAAQRSYHCSCHNVSGAYGKTHPISSFVVWDYVCSLCGSSPTLHTAYARIVSQVGIRVFVTGGIGGVHRGVEATMDISADLTELGRTPVAVVCAGVKSILDIPRTLEFLVLCVMMLVRWLLLLLPLLLTRSWCHVAIDCAACSTGDTRRDGSHSGRQGVPSLLHRAQRLLVPAHDRLCTGCRQANP